jgi:TfoX/Sxy family transcriptional regulator of competence genes
MSNDVISKLEAILNAATVGLAKVESKKMFGCHALWAHGNVFALVWKHGRVGLKLPNELSYSALMKISGSEPWKAGPVKMSHWVLVPETFHKKSGELKKWAAKAHSECSVLEKKSSKVKSKPTVANKKKAK